MSTPVPGEDDRLSVRAALANESMESVLSIWSSELPCRMLHSSVHHPQTPEDAPPRRSVELRMLAIFEA